MPAKVAYRGAASLSVTVARQGSGASRSISRPSKGHCAHTCPPLRVSVWAWVSWGRLSASASSAPVWATSLSMACPPIRIRSQLRFSRAAFKALAAAPAKVPSGNGTSARTASSQPMARASRRIFSAVFCPAQRTATVPPSASLSRRAASTAALSSGFMPPGADGAVSFSSAESASTGTLSESGRIHTTHWIISRFPLSSGI